MNQWIDLAQRVAAQRMEEAADAKESLHPVEKETFSFYDACCHLLLLLRSGEEAMQKHGVKRLEEQLEGGQFLSLLSEKRDWNDAKLLYPLYWIVQELEAKGHFCLHEKMEKVLRLLLRSCLSLAEEKGAPEFLQLALAAVAQQCGQKWRDAALRAAGEQLWQELDDWRQSFSFTDATALWFLAGAYQILCQSTSLQTLVERSCFYFDPHRGLFLSPKRESRQHGFMPHLSPFDWMLRVWLQVQHPHEEACAQVPLSIVSLACVYPFAFVLQQNHTKEPEGLLKSPSASYLIEERKHATSPFLPLQIFWGSSAAGVHSFVAEVQDPSVAVEARLQQGGACLRLQMSQRPMVAKKTWWVCSFYCDMQPGMVWQVKDQSATLLQLGDQMFLKTPQGTIEVSFQLQQGAGHFVCHLFKKNRMGQMLGKEPSTFQVYDWVLALRGVDLIQTPCQIEVQIKCKWHGSEG